MARQSANQHRRIEPTTTTLSHRPSLSRQKTSRPLSCRRRQLLTSSPEMSARVGRGRVPRRGRPMVAQLGNELWRVISPCSSTKGHVAGSVAASSGSSAAARRLEQSSSRHDRIAPRSAMRWAAPVRSRSRLGTSPRPPARRPSGVLARARRPAICEHILRGRLSGGARVGAGSGQPDH
jgi:hypothetical protein